MQYCKRKSRLSVIIAKRKSVLLLGPRGTGKSTYVNHYLKTLKEKNVLINLLETDTFRKYLTSPYQLRKEIDFNLKQYESLHVFLDLCAGTGAVGLEAISRGASEVFLVEKNRSNSKCIQANIKMLKDSSQKSYMEMRS